MNQEEINRELWKIFAAVSARTGRPILQFYFYIDRVLNRRGITDDLPMHATARLLVARDVLRIWEGTC